MDSILQLALMTKASKVFAKEGQFLSFPALSPYSFGPEQLAFAVKPSTADDWRAYSEFSRAVNHVARGPIQDPVDDAFLWDIVDHVLRQGQCAGRQRAFSPEEEAEYQAALALLYDRPDGGARVPSAAAELYGQYRDAILIAEEEYRNRELSAEFGEDEGIRARWRNVEAPARRRQLDELYADWGEKGRRSAIESARQCLRVHSAAESAQTWSTWRTNFNPDLDMPTDILLNRFAGTSFTPADIAGDADWPQFTLEHGEIITLAGEANPELRQRLGAEVGDIERIVFECRSVGLDRSWLPKDLFAARFWRLPVGEEPLSDGADPPRGRLPAYAVGVIFARNIQVLHRQVAGGGRVHYFSAVNLFNLAVAQPVASRAVGPAEFKSEPNFVPSGLLRKTMPLRHRIPVRRPWRPPVPPPPQPAESVPADPNVTILAMICRRIPRSPDPDPALPWPSQG